MRINEEKLIEVERAALVSFEENARSRAISGYGELETMRERTIKLERAVAHLMGVVAAIHNLTEEEIENAGGLFDY